MLDLANIWAIHIGSILLLLLFVYTVFSITHLKCISFGFNPVIQNMCSNDPKRALQICVFYLQGIIKWVQSHQTHGVHSTVML